MFFGNISPENVYLHFEWQWIYVMKRKIYSKMNRDEVHVVLKPNVEAMLLNTEL